MARILERRCTGRDHHGQRTIRGDLLVASPPCMCSAPPALPLPRARHSVAPIQGDGWGNRMSNSGGKMIRNWKRTGIALCALGIGFGAVVAHGPAMADEISVGTDKQTSIAVTIYNQDLALIRDARTI